MIGPLTLVYAPQARLLEAEEFALGLRRSGQRAQVRDVAGLDPAAPQPADVLVALDCVAVVQAAYPGQAVQTMTTAPKPAPTKPAARKRAAGGDD